MVLGPPCAVSWDDSPNWPPRLGETPCFGGRDFDYPARGAPSRPSRVPTRVSKMTSKINPNDVQNDVQNDAPDIPHVSQKVPRNGRRFGTQFGSKRAVKLTTVTRFRSNIAPSRSSPKGTKKDSCWRASCISAVPRQGPEKDPPKGPQNKTK